MKIEFDSKTVYGEDDKYIKTKIKTYGGRVITNFPRKKMPKEKAPCKCLSIIMLDCYQSKEKVLSSNTFGRMQIWTRKYKSGEPYWWWFRKKWIWWVW